MANRQNFNPKVWGPHGWHLLHTVAMSYRPVPTRADKQAMRQFITSLPSVLPCEACGANFGTYLANNSLDQALESRDNLIRFIIGAQNKVRESNGSAPFREMDVLNHYDTLYSGRVHYNSTTKLMAVLVVLFILYLYMK